MEEWRKVEEYPMYEVSSLGRVRSYYKVVRGIRSTPQILSNKTDRIGYSFVHLQNEKGRKPLRIHRLVAKAFIPNPQLLPEVNHIDENKQNNCVENLEWISRLNNIRHSKVWESVKREVAQYDINHVYIKTWYSMSEAARAFNTSPQNIFCAIRDKRVRVGYYWEYVN